MKERKSTTGTLIREVAEETRLEIVPIRLLYVAEVVGGYRVHDLNLVWLAEPEDPAFVISEDALVPQG